MNKKIFLVILTFVFVSTGSYSAHARMMNAQSSMAEAEKPQKAKTVKSSTKGYIDIGQHGAPYESKDDKAQRLTGDELEKLKKKMAELNRNVGASAQVQSIQSPNAAAAAAGVADISAAAKQAKQVQELPRLSKKPPQAPKF